MILIEFQKHLNDSPDHELCFLLPDGGRIEAHAHITEVGLVEKSFLDCGGIFRKTAHCSLQAWTADDIDHRLTPRQLAAILDKAKSFLGNGNLDVEIEYEDCRITQFPVESTKTENGLLIFQLGTKRTACLAREVCLPNVTSSSDCC